MKTFKFQFLYDKQKRAGILFLIGLILAGISFLFWYDSQKEVIISQEEQLAVFSFQKEIDSLKVIEIENRKPKIFPFNPNYISDYRGYNLGMSVEEIDRLHRFRESGKWINSTADFKRVTKVSDSLLAAISPYFKFPEWVTNPKPKKEYVSKSKWKAYDEKGELNSITLELLMSLEGMDEESAQKIISHHSKIGGYQVDQQIYDVYGVPTKIKRVVLNEFTVKEKPAIVLLDVNKASASDLSTVPLLDFDLAKEIVDYRILHEGIKSIDELIKLDGMTDYKFARIRLYLKIE